MNRNATRVLLAVIVVVSLFGATASARTVDAQPTAKLADQASANGTLLQDDEENETDDETSIDVQTVDGATVIIMRNAPESVRVGELTVGEATVEETTVQRERVIVIRTNDTVIIIVRQ